MKRDQLAIAAATTWNAPLEEFLAAGAAAGFVNVELPLDRIKSYPIGQVASLLARHGLRCVAATSLQPLACFADVEALAQNHACLLGDAKTLSDLGGGVIVVMADPPA